MSCDVMCWQLPIELTKSRDNGACIISHCQAILCKLVTHMHSVALHTSLNVKEISIESRQLNLDSSHL